MAWKVDPEQSKIEFIVKHLRVTRVRGLFGSYEGTVELDEENPEASSVQGTIDVARLKTAIPPRDANLRSSGFFDVKRFPKMSFRSTRIGPFEGDNFAVYGELTIKDNTREVVFDVVNKGEIPVAKGRKRWAFEASIALNRKDFGLEWNPLIELGGLLVGEEVNGKLEIQFVEE